MGSRVQAGKGLPGVGAMQGHLGDCTVFCVFYRVLHREAPPTHLRVGDPWLEETVLPQVSHLGARDFLYRKRGLEVLSGRGEGRI